MLEAAGVPFETVDAPLDEEEAKRRLGVLGAADLAGALAEAKARSVRAGSAALVLGSDQTLERGDGTMLSKPSSREEAIQQLRSLSGRTHRLHSAAALVEGGNVVWRATETAALTVRPLSDLFVNQYLDEEYDAIRWSVGGYRIEGPGVQLFERIEGSHFAILGMPLLPLLSFLRERRLLVS
jgi:septum formation protein